MKYQITCAHCNTRFLVEGKGGQTVECTCPGCGGTMRINLPKSEKDASADEEPENDGYQQGYVPADGDNGGGDDGDNGDNRKRHRALALGCLFFIVVIAAAIVAFMALNHTTKKPIEDPYEYVEPDTASVDTIPEDTEEVEVDTVQVHEEKPKVKAAPVDTAETVAAPDASEDAEATEPSSDASSESTTKSSSKDHHSSSSDQTTTSSKSSKSSKKSDSSAPTD